VTIVVDASLVIAVLANRPADELLRKRLSSPRVLHAPYLIDVEVASGIRGLLLGGHLTSDRAAEMIADFRSLRIVRHPMAAYLDRVLELRHNLTAYDACYIALAESVGLPLFTRDAKLRDLDVHSADVRIHP
jgi:predicted nucleic acid-binding protein